jgi:hypothetical protein
MSRVALQWITAFLALIPLLTGALGLLGLRDPLYVAVGVLPNAVLDSNLRFFSGFWLGGGLAMLWVVPRIEKEVALFSAHWGMIFLGGLGRVASLLFAGPPPIPLAPILAVLGLELLGAPVFILWQRQVAVDARACVSDAHR